MGDVLSQPLSSAEFLVVDVETNGKAGDECELTELGAVLVGGGELHDRWETLVGVRAPLSRMIQRFTGISQAMVDEAPAVELVLPDLAEQLEGRVLVGHNVAFDRRVLRQAFARAELEWPDVARAVHRRARPALAPLARRRGLRPLAEALGIEVETAHRALADAETCARVLCALLPRLVVHAGTVGDAVELLKAAARGRAAPAPGARSRARAARSTASTSPGCPTSRASTSSATPAARSSTSASRSPCAPARGRTSSPARRPRAGSRRRRWSTTARPPPSSARSCSSSGSSRRCARRATCA